MLPLNSNIFTDRSRILKPQFSSINFCSDSRRSATSTMPNLFVSFSNHDFFSINVNLRNLIPPSTRSRVGALVFSDSCNTARGDQCGENIHILDDLLSGVEVACLASSIMISLLFAMNREFPTSRMKGALTLQMLATLSTVAIGVFIRRLQWKRIQHSSVQNHGVYGVSGAVFRDRIEKIEEETGRTTVIIRALSRHVEKLGIRFRITRKSLKSSISETTSLAKKNSEITQSLVEHDRNLENEIVEIQGVLLAMQEQQKRQLDLILEIGKSWKGVSENNMNVETPATAATTTIEINKHEDRKRVTDD